MFRWPVPATMLIDDAVALVREVAAELRGDPTIYPFIWSPMELQGVESFDNGQAVLRFRFKTAPLRQWEVQRAFNLAAPPAGPGRAGTVDAAPERAAVADAPVPQSRAGRGVGQAGLTSRAQPPSISGTNR